RAGRCAAAAIAGAGSGAIVGRLANDTGILLTVMLGVGAAAAAAAVALGVSSVGRDRTLGVAALRVRAQPSAAVDRPVR
ncbi:MAG: hypothetical protein JWN20_2262, partial [Jatrophihabitantaceae bacterium]|nr:hypothetical protein [Jatrophihabitantaceae bacterium]